MNEEVVVRTGIDNSAIGRGMRQFAAAIGQGAQGAHGALVHVESAGKAFHKVLHEISQTSPVMGEALRLAVSPVTGVLLGAVMLFERVHEHIKSNE